MRAFNDVAPYTAPRRRRPGRTRCRSSRPIVGDGVRRLRRRPGRRRRGRGRDGRRLGRHQRRRRRGRGRAADRGRPREVPRRHARRRSPSRRPGSSSPARSRSSPSRRPRWPRCCSRRAAEVGATVAREGVEFGVVSRVPAVGGQVMSLQGLRGALRRGLPAAVRRPPGPERRRRAGRGRGLRRRQPLDDDLVRAAFAEVTSPGPARGHPAQPDDRARRRAQPARRRGDGRGAGGLVRVLAAHRGGRRDGRQGLRGRARGASSRTSPTWSAPRTPPPARCRPRSWPRPRVEIFGEDRVTVDAPARRRDRPGRGARRGGRGVRRPARLRRGAGHRLGRHRRRGPRDARGAR